MASAAPSQNLVHFTQFKQEVYKAALEILGQRDPEYVQKQSLHLSEEAKPGKGLPNEWQEVMEALVSYELGMEDMKMSLKLLGTPCPLAATICTSGQWVNLHFNGWLNLTYSWQEKLKRLVILVLRRFAVNKDDPKGYANLLSNLDSLWKKFKQMRGEYVHVVGAVKGISQHDGWEFALVSGIDVATDPHVRSYQSDAQLQSRWHQLLFMCTIALLENIEKYFQRLNERLFFGSKT